MAVDIGAVMRCVRNYFQRDYAEGEFSISGGSLSPAPVAPYVYIKGSAQHDGVWLVDSGKLVGADGMPSEAFKGRVWGLYPPRDFVTLVGEVEAYDAENPAGALQSESFGTYSYTRGSASNGASISWQEVFAGRLIPYRRMFTEVE